VGNGQRSGKRKAAPGAHREMRGRREHRGRGFTFALFERKANLAHKKGQGLQLDDWNLVAYRVRLRTLSRDGLDLFDGCGFDFFEVLHKVICLSANFFKHALGARLNR